MWHNVEKRIETDIYRKKIELKKNHTNKQMTKNLQGLRNICRLHHILTHA